MALELNVFKYRIYEYVEFRMFFIVFNFFIIIGAFTVVKIMGEVSGLRQRGISGSDGLGFVDGLCVFGELYLFFVRQDLVSEFEYYVFFVFFLLIFLEIIGWLVCFFYRFRERMMVLIWLVFEFQENRGQIGCEGKRQQGSRRGQEVGVFQLVCFGSFQFCYGFAGCLVIVKLVF